MKYDLTLAIIEDSGMACVMNNFIVLKKLDQTYELISKETLTGIDCPKPKSEPQSAPLSDFWLCETIPIICNLLFVGGRREFGPYM